MSAGRSKRRGLRHYVLGQGQSSPSGPTGATETPTKVPVTVRYSPEVVAYFKATGEGWQTRMNDALQEYVERHRAA